MKILNSYIMGAVSEIAALKAVIQDNNQDADSKKIISSISHSPGFKVRWNFDHYGDMNTAYVYPIAEGYYRVDFTSQ